MEKRIGKNVDHLDHFTDFSGANVTYNINLDQT
jgi:hypothetical protein